MQINDPINLFPGIRTPDQNALSVKKEEKSSWKKPVIYAALATLTTVGTLLAAAWNFSSSKPSEEKDNTNKEQFKKETKRSSTDKDFTGHSEPSEKPKLTSSPTSEPVTTAYSSPTPPQTSLPFSSTTRDYLDQFCWIDETPCKQHAPRQPFKPTKICILNNIGKTGSCLPLECGLINQDLGNESPSNTSFPLWILSSNHQSFGFGLSSMVNPSEVACLYVRDP